MRGSTTLRRHPQPRCEAWDQDQDADRSFGAARLACLDGESRALLSLRLVRHGGRQLQPQCVELPAVCRVRTAKRFQIPLDDAGTMARVTELSVQRLDFRPMPGLAMFRPARRGLQFLLEARAGGPFTVDLEQCTILGHAYRTSATQAGRGTAFERSP